ncbi:MAG: hypothetical protein A2991_00180 [Candidatus Terrybacteria bacterium RIFCSPLOWO2_01_FULL_58_14]|uniref:Uncharacterized protein n=1 Tax=Candidatus Terrybacteria bacterium RIFCSPLOWO2_01_FULL_58_14 TaxID=1802369 RepID=A0A1G2PWX3_9BACT|nr:MAG: hypothetical protein A2991_00180 [Candidatus Terrybacteria bacterium RIFCSPLOWO2_01_FULL_58_14]
MPTHVRSSGIGEEDAVFVRVVAAIGIAVGKRRNAHLDGSVHCRAQCRVDRHVDSWSNEAGNEHERIGCGGIIATIPACARGVPETSRAAGNARTRE